MGEMRQTFDFSATPKSTTIMDNRGRLIRFPGRRDYLDHLLGEGVIASENALLGRPDLVEDIYLNWLRRGQVGCMFAQLFGRRTNRLGLRTLILPNPTDPRQSRDLASQIDARVQDAIVDPEVESVSVLLPQVLTPEHLVLMMLALSEYPLWTIEQEWRWRPTMVLVGLRVQLQEHSWAEVLGLGPFQFLPPPRQSPFTSLEIRTKTKRAKRSNIHRGMLAHHLADIPTDHFLDGPRFGRLFRLTQRLRTRVLGGTNDQRAKARVTLAVPAAMWEGLKSKRPWQPPG